MRDIVYEGILKHIIPLSGFEKAELIEVRPGFASFKIDIINEMLNPYGNVHGGVLYTLCDMAAAMSTFAYECTSVTLSGNINYIKGANEGFLIVSSETIHKGKTTEVNDVTIKDKEDKLIASARMTMYITGTI